MTRDRWPSLRRSLPRHEAPVVLVDNGSTDGTPALVARHFPDVDVVALRRNEGAVARNVGVLRARTSYVAFADDDSWWAPGATDHAADLMDEHPALGLVAARVLVGEADREDPINAAMDASPLPGARDVPGRPVLGFLACGAVVRREAFLSAGGFDPVIFFMGEEERLALDLRSAGWELRYVSDVVAHHHPSGAGTDPAKVARADRNRLLTALLRRPWPVVADELRRLGTAGAPGRAAVRAAWSALPGAVAGRRPLAAGLEAERRLLG